jgi:cobalamin biosynthesis protein CobT
MKFETTIDLPTGPGPMQSDSQTVNESQGQALARHLRAVANLIESDQLSNISSIRVTCTP